MRSDNECLLYVALTFSFLRYKVAILCPSRCPVPLSHDEGQTADVNVFNLRFKKYKE